MLGRIVFAGLAAVLNGNAVIALILDYVNTGASEQLFFPLLRIRAHMHAHIIADGGTHDTDAKPQISCRTDFDGVA